MAAGITARMRVCCSSARQHSMVQACGAALSWQRACVAAPAVAQARTVANARRRARARRCAGIAAVCEGGGGQGGGAGL